MKMIRLGWRSLQEGKPPTTRRLVISELLRNIDDTLPLEEAAMDLAPMEIEITDTVIDFEGPALVVEIPDFADNLVDFMEDGDVEHLSSELSGQFESDKSSRMDWEESYVKGLDLLGLKIEDRTQPWPGACGVFHPLLTESVVRFQSQTITEVFPASGPVRTSILGKETKEKVQQAARVQAELNYQLTEVMTEYRPEFEQLLFHLPLAGSAFKKVYFDPSLGRACAMFVPAEDFVVSHGASDLMTSPRYTHVMRRTKNDVRKLQVAGFYRDVDIPDPSPDYSRIQDKIDDLDGSAEVEADGRLVLLEMHVDLDLPGFEDLGSDMEPTGIELPYVVTMIRGTGKILSIYRNYREEDSLKIKRLHFVHYQYLPGLGFYGTGLIHLIGGLAKSATSILRQLVDAGTLSNLPAGLKARGLRIKGDDAPIMPGEFRDVDIPGGSIKDNISFLPYKEPSSVLYQLLGNIVEEGRRIGSVADLQVGMGQGGKEAPVGTTLAIMERAMKVMSAVQARVHASLRAELRLLSNVISTSMEDVYDYEFGEGESYSRVEDFDSRVDIIPVSDPNAASMSQRVMQYQAAFQLANSNPNLYDMPMLHRQMMQTLGIPNADEIVKSPENMKPMDPVSENMAMMKMKPVKSFVYQDHEAHIKTHMAAAQDPLIQGLVKGTPMAKSMEAALAAHVAEHVAFQYRREIEKAMGVQLPDSENPLPEDVEFQYSKLVADAAEKVLAKDKAIVESQKRQQMEQDPIVQMQQRELAIKEAEVKRKSASDQARTEIERERIQTNAALKAAEIAAEDKRTGLQVGIEIAKTKEQLEADGKRDGLKFGLDIAKSHADRASKEKLEGTRLGIEVGRSLLDQSNKNNGNS